MIGTNWQRIAANAAFANGLFGFGHIDLRVVVVAVVVVVVVVGCLLKFNFNGFLLKISLKPILSINLMHRIVIMK